MKAWGRLGAGLVVAGLLTGSGAGAAEEKKPEDTKPEAKKQDERWKFRVEANTDFPLGVGGRLGLVSPWRLHLSTSVDYLIPTYVRAGNGVALAAGFYDQRKADFIEHAVKDSLSWRTHLGWQPFADSGFYLEAGYGLLVLGGETNPEEALTSLLFIDPPEGEASLQRPYRVSAMVHQLDLELGWRWKLAEHWSIRAALGGTLTLDSNSRVEPQEPSDSVIIEAFSRLAENRIDTTFEKYGYLPSLSLSVGYTF